MIIDAIASKLTSYLIKKEVIENDHFEVYKYGLELLISSVFETIIIYLIGILFFSVVDSFIFIVCFVLIRSFCGGFHAKSYYKCLIYTTLTFIIVSILTHALQLSSQLFVLLAFVNIGIVAFTAPVENEAKPINENQKRRLKIISIIICFAFATICVVLYLHKCEYAYNFIYSMTSVSVLLILGIIVSKKHKQDTK